MYFTFLETSNLFLFGQEVKSVAAFSIDDILSFRYLGLLMDVMKVDGPAGFWIFCKSYLEPKSSKVLVISFEHL